MRLLRHFSSPFSSEWSGQKRVITNYTVIREDLLLNLSPIKASFTMKGNYISIKSKGNMIAEFVPREDSPYDSTKKNLLVKDKRIFVLSPENLHAIITMKGPLTFTKESNEELKTFQMIQDRGIWSCKLTINGPNQANITKAIELKDFEVYYIQKFCEVRAT